MGQVVETDDGMPFIGENAPRQFIATGFCGNGFTLGTLSAMMMRDRFLDRPNTWTTLLAVGRSPFHGGVWRYLRENLDYPYYLLRDRMAPADSGSIDDLAAGEGRIMKVDGNRVAAYRDTAGKVSMLSPVCTHLKCIVHWNRADRTWDCPCHGSRFHPTGEVLSGPAEDPLERISRDLSSP
jgi:nitrite reductase/ring-hydroxylating ferredoxin subunit